MAETQWQENIISLLNIYKIISYTKESEIRRHSYKKNDSQRVTIIEIRSRLLFVGVIPLSNITPLSFPSIYII